jgi:serine/threonine-protein kinase
VSDTLAGVLKTDIDLSQLPKDCPDGLRDLVVRCLDRSTSTRLRDIGEARVVLERPLTRRTTASPTTSNRRGAYVAIGGVVGLILGAVLMLTLAPGSSDPVNEREVRFSIERETESTPRSDLSPDGSRLLYTTGGRLWVREFSSLESREVPGSEGAIVCAWSPDGQWIVYSTSSTLYKSRPDGSGRTRLCEVANDMHSWAGSVDWTEDGRVVFAAGDAGLMSVSSSGGDPKVLLAPGENETDFHHISTLPGDRGFLFQPHIDLAFDSIHLLVGNERREILRMEGQAINSAIYAQGHLVFTRVPENPGTWAVPFSLDDLTTTGDPFLVVADGFFPTVSHTGDLAFAPDSTPIVQIVRLDERGIVTGEVGEPIDGASDLRISPDGREGLIVIEEETNGLWIVDLATGDRHRFTFSKSEISNPAWSASGNRIIYSSGRSEADLHQEIRERDGTQTTTVNVRGREPRLTRDERYMLMSVWTDANESNIGYVDLEDPGSSPIMLLESLTAETEPVLSPDERFMAYTSVESGRHEIYVRSFPDGDGHWQISSDGGIRPFWSPSGDRLFFSAPGGTMLMVVDVTTHPIRFSSPRLQFQQDSLRDLNITANGDFYALRRLAGAAQGSYAVWLNWRVGAED